MRLADVAPRLARARDEEVAFRKRVAETRRLGFLTGPDAAELLLRNLRTYCDALGVRVRCGPGVLDSRTLVARSLLTVELDATIQQMDAAGIA